MNLTTKSKRLRDYLIEIFKIIVINLPLDFLFSVHNKETNGLKGSEKCLQIRSHSMTFGDPVFCTRYTGTKDLVSAPDICSNPHVSGANIRCGYEQISVSIRRKYPLRIQANIRPYPSKIPALEAY